MKVEISDRIAEAVKVLVAWFPALGYSGLDDFVVDSVRERIILIKKCAKGWDSEEPPKNISDSMVDVDELPWRTSPKGHQYLHDDEAPKWLVDSVNDKAIRNSPYDYWSYSNDQGKLMVFRKTKEATK